MGYTSTAEGHFDIVPPLTITELRKHPDFRGTQDRQAIVVTEEETVQTDDGDLIRKAGVRVEPAFLDEDVKRYDLQEHLQEIVTAYPGHEFPGHIKVLGEDGDRWGYHVVNGQVVEVCPVVRWPWGEETDDDDMRSE